MNDADPIDTLTAEQFSPLGDTPAVLVELDRPDAAAIAHQVRARTHAIVIGIDRAGSLPPVEPEDFDVLLTQAPAPPTPWVAVAQDRTDALIARILQTIHTAPVAAAICMRTLRTGAALAFDDAMQVESLAYSALLGGAEFRHWLAARGQPETPEPLPPSEYVTVARNDARLSIALSDPASRNAICAPMRDALFEALAAALDDPSMPDVTLTGEGACFSVGGELREFGTASDLSRAHFVRSLRSCAVLLHRLGPHAVVRLHGACIGSGIEIPAAAARRIGTPDAFFQLPELAMGLMPGAGGTVTLPRCIGRHRTAYMVLTAERIRAQTALEWGLLHAVERA